MSYRGRPSKGCESCRSRKVKCDEGKPRCGRCAKSNSECKYRDQADLLFRNQTAFAAQKAEDSWRKRAKSHTRAPSSDASRQSPPSVGSQQSPPSDGQSPESNRHASPTTEQSGTNLPQPSSLMPEFHNLNIGNYETLGPGDPASVSAGIFDTPTLGYEVQPDPAQTAYDRFVYDFVVPENLDRPAGEPNDSLWDFVPALYQHAPEDSCLAAIVRATSFANYANRYHDVQARHSSDEEFGKGIKRLQQAIRSPKEAATDATLAAVYLMGVYENLTSTSFSGGYLAHKEGANALIKLRTMEQFYSNPITTRLYEASYAQMLIGNLQSAMPPALPIRTKNLAAARKNLPNLLSTSGIYVIQLISREAELHARWTKTRQTALTNPPTTRMELQDLLSTALALDADFQAWESTLPATWQYHILSNTAEVRSQYDGNWANVILGSPGAPSEIHYYSSLKRAWIWVFYRTTRIFLLRDLLEILNWMLKLPEPGPSPTPNHAYMDATAGADAMAFTDTEVLGSMRLNIHHLSATKHLVDVVEQSAAAILGHFTVVIPSKSMDDVVGMRGYTSFWSLGVLNAVLRSGLVPDSGSAVQYPLPSIHEEYPNPGPSSWNAYAETSYQVPGGSPPYLSADSPNTPTLSANSPATPTNYTYTPGPAPAQPSQIDVQARRRWIIGVLYYMGTDLGIKKSLAIVAFERGLGVQVPGKDSAGTVRVEV